jgi:hypothetical protein
MLSKWWTILDNEKDCSQRNEKKFFFTIRWAAWISTGAWLGEEVVSVVIIVAFEPVKGDTIWKTEKKRSHYKEFDKIIFVPRGRIGAASTRSYKNKV